MVKPAIVKDTTAAITKGYLEEQRGMGAHYWAATCFLGFLWIGTPHTGALAVHPPGPAEPPAGRQGSGHRGNPGWHAARTEPVEETRRKKTHIVCFYVREHACPHADTQTNVPSCVIPLL